MCVYPYSDLIHSYKLILQYLFNNDKRFYGLVTEAVPFFVQAISLQAVLQWYPVKKKQDFQMVMRGMLKQAQVASFLNSEYPAFVCTLYQK